MGLFGNGDVGTEEAEIADENPQALATRLNDLEVLIDDDDKTAKRNGTYAAAKLAGVDPDSAVELLHNCGVYVAAKDAKVRANSVYFLRELRDDYPDEIAQYQDELAWVAQNDSIPRNRKHAVEALSRIDTETASQAIQAVKTSDSSTDLRQLATELLERQGGPERTTNTSSGTGLLKSCVECSTNFEDLDGIPRLCPGCGMELKKML